jgi:hypothetical protein
LDTPGSRATAFSTARPDIATADIATADIATADAVGGNAFDLRLTPATVGRRGTIMDLLGDISAARRCG